VAQYMNPAKISDWSTPDYLYQSLDREFHFELDACASPENAKCSKFYGVQEDSLMLPWAKSTWCNPPYGKPISKFIHKAVQESKDECPSGGH
jgi:phage N-6-adenine-methyltransferase